MVQSAGEIVNHASLIRLRRYAGTSAYCVALVVMLATPLAAQLDAPLTFERTAVLATPSANSALWIAAADFHRDGRADLVVVNVDGTASVLLGRGGGAFEAPRVVVSTPLPVRHVIAADMNGDGRPDIVATHPMAHLVSVVLTRDGGAFSPAETYPCGTAPGGVAAADFNGDGQMDLAVINSSGLLPSLPGSTVTILPGAGGGRFRPPLTTQLRFVRPQALAAGDLNGDGRADLVVISAMPPSPVEVFMGNADGTMSPSSAPLINLFGFPSGLAIDDLNGDGNADLVVTAGPRITWWRGRGHGTFDPPAGSDFESSSFVLVDVNGDGLKDAVGANVLFNVAIVAINLGEVGFGQQQPFVVGARPSDVAAADFTGDGVVDLLTPEQGSPNVTLLRNTTPRPLVLPNSLVNGASFRSGPATVAPGEIVTIFGGSLGPRQLVTARFDRPGYLATELGTTRVFFNGIPAPLIFARIDQVSAVAPHALRPGETIWLQVAHGPMFSMPTPLRVVPANPGIFTSNASGSGPAAVTKPGWKREYAGTPGAARHDRHVLCDWTGVDESARRGWQDFDAAAARASA